MTPEQRAAHYARDAMITYRRADGEEIWGEFAFLCEPDGLDDCDEGAEYIKETWMLVTRETEWHGPPELSRCPVCGGKGLVPATGRGSDGTDECDTCKGEGVTQ